MKYFITLKRRHQPPFQIERIFNSTIEAIAFSDGLNKAVEVFGLDARFQILDEAGRVVERGEFY